MGYYISTSWRSRTRTNIDKRIIFTLAIRRPEDRHIFFSKKAGGPLAEALPIGFEVGALTFILDLEIERCMSYP
jgi:hypothetical protein